MSTNSTATFSVYNFTGEPLQLVLSSTVPSSGIKPYRIVDAIQPVAGFTTVVFPLTPIYPSLLGYNTCTFLSTDRYGVISTYDIAYQNGDNNAASTLWNLVIVVGINDSGVNQTILADGSNVAVPTNDGIIYLKKYPKWYIDSVKDAVGVPAGDDDDDDSTETPTTKFNLKHIVILVLLLAIVAIVTMAITTVYLKKQYKA